jgi:protein O-GlcNAc transferase
MPPQVTIQQAFDLALQHHNAGRPQEAENLCRQILAQQPANFAAMHLLGVIARQTGRVDLAIDLLRRAVTLNPNSPEAHTNLGNALRDKGQLDESIASHRRAISLNPDIPETHNNLANALKISGQFDEAIASYRHAIALRPNYADAHSNLGSALKDNGQLTEAIAAFRRAIQLNPNLPQAHSNLGSALKDNGQLDEAIAAHRHAIALRLGYAEAHSNLGNALKDHGQLEEAIAAYRKAVALQPNFVEAHTNLGNALRDMGLLDEAIAACWLAIALNPNLPEPHSNLGNALRDKGQLDQAIAAFHRAIAIRPNYSEAHNNLGNALRDNGRLDEAVAAFHRAIAARPNYAEAHNNLGNALKDKGELNDAVAAYRRAIALRPNYAQAHSNLVFALYYHAGDNPSAIAAELADWNRQHAHPLRPLVLPHQNSLDLDRPLRIGYVSADFRHHSVSYFLLPLFRHHDHGAHRIICYSDVAREDAMTDHLRACTDEWHKIVGFSDERVADKIGQDKIDILVDLAGHSKGNRLRVFAQKPAPVQITYLGFPGSTGLPEIDYRLTDPFADPVGQTESLHTEKLWRLPTCNWCYAEPEDAPEVRPSRPEAPVCFGSFNNFAKASPAVIDLWAAILTAVPSSRLIIKSRGLGEQSIRQKISGHFESRGIQPDRLEIRGSEPDVRSHLQVYNQMDIALDTFPYHGTTTTCEALWMGVPVVSLAGKSHVSRVGVSLLNAVGLPDLVAQSAQEYVSIAVQLASDLPRLADLRRTLRARMRASPLMDAPKFARNIEAAYRQMWQTWRQSISARS